MGHWVHDIMRRGTTQNDITQWHRQCRTLVHRFCSNEIVCTTIMFCNNCVLRQFNQTTGQVTCLCRFQRGIRHTLTRTVGWCEVFRHCQTFFKVWNNWNFDNRTVWLLHHTTHTCDLLNLALGTTRLGHSHHINTVPIFARCLTQRFVCLVTQFVGCFLPQINQFIVTFTTR